MAAYDTLNGEFDIALFKKPFYAPSMRGREQISESNGSMTDYEIGDTVPVKAWNYVYPDTFAIVDAEGFGSKYPIAVHLIKEQKYVGTFIDPDCVPDWINGAPAYDHLGKKLLGDFSAKQVKALLDASDARCKEEQGIFDKYNDSRDYLFEREGFFMDDPSPDNARELDEARAKRESDYIAIQKELDELMDSFILNNYAPDEDKDMRRLGAFLLLSEDFSASTDMDEETKEKLNRLRAEAKAESEELPDLHSFLAWNRPTLEDKSRIQSDYQNLFS